MGWMIAYGLWLRRMREGHARRKLMRALCGGARFDSHDGAPWTPLYYHRRALRNYVAARIPELPQADWSGGMSVLDMGCGSMPYRSLFLAHGAYRRYVGADIEQVGAAEARIDPVTQRVDVDTGSFEVVVHFQTLEHVQHPDRMLRECHRVLRPGGKMLCTVPFLFEYHAVPDDYRRWTRVGLAVELESAGFRVLRIDAIESDWGSALTVLALVIARRWGYRLTKPLFLASNLLARLPAGASTGYSPLTWGAIGLKTT